MSAVIMDGVALAKRIKTNIREWSEKLPYVPHLAVIMVGDNPASRTYISGKIRDCSECGFESHVHFFTDRTTENELRAAYLDGKLSFNDYRTKLGLSPLKY